MAQALHIYHKQVSKHKHFKGEDIMTQEQILQILFKKGFTWNHSSYDDYEGGDTHYLSKKPKRYLTQMVEVSPDGLCNGLSLDEYLKTI